MSESPEYKFVSKDDSSTPYNPFSSDSNAQTENVEKEPVSPDFPPPQSVESETSLSPASSKFNDEKLDDIYSKMSSQNKQQIDKLPKEEQKDILKRVESKRDERDPDEDKNKTAILEVEEKTDNDEENEDTEDDDKSNTSSIPPPPGALKKVNFNIE